jgi:hypothetical protein
MGHRDVRRVPLTFNWPLNKVWDGYLRPARTETCQACNGTNFVVREGYREICWDCDDGEVNIYEGPPEGPGWQLWETTSEGSPTSPVFEAAEALARWATNNATVFAGMKATYGEWLTMIVGDALDEMAASDPDREHDR